jgi:putative NADH-flavin reductase
MKIALIGATGMIGSRILSEALARGHEVIAIVRKPEAVPAHERVRAIKGDAIDAPSLAAAVAGADVVVSAYSPQSGPPDDLSRHVLALMTALPQAGISRVIVVGGAGSSEVAPGVLLEDTPDFPPQFKVRAHAQKAMLDVFRSYASPPVIWTFVCPPLMIAPGTRTGAYRIGGDRLVQAADGTSSISAEDYAIAILDQTESPQYPNARITVGY